MENKDSKKQIPLRLSPKLYNAIAAWAEDDFRSVNGQIEYLLSECVRQRKKNGKYVGEEIDVPPDLDIWTEKRSIVYYQSKRAGFVKPALLLVNLHRNKALTRQFARKGFVFCFLNYFPTLGILTIISA